jgi:hypothetical protein
VSERRIREVPGGGSRFRKVSGKRSAAAWTPFPEGARSLLALAAVIGREFSYNLLVASSGLPREMVVDRLTELGIPGQLVET